jgi:hypothetical protein
MLWAYEARILLVSNSVHLGGVLDFLRNILSLFCVLRHKAAKSGVKLRYIFEFYFRGYVF